jgi:hypothetical protein
VVLDKVSDAIAHFIGLFQIETEQARMRDDYLQFKALQAAQQPQHPDDPSQISFHSPYDFDDPDPGIHYVPNGPDYVSPAPVDIANYQQLEVPVPTDVQALAYPGYIYPIIHAGSHSLARMFELQPPGAVVAHISQVNALSDNDFVHVGPGNVEFHQIGTPNLALAGLLDQADHALPIGPAAFGAAQDIGDFVSGSAAALNALVAGNEGATSDSIGPGDGDGVTIETIVSAFNEPVADAIYVNGHIVADAPRLDDMLPSASPLAKDAPDLAPDPTPAGGNHAINGGGDSAAGSSAYGQGELSSDMSVTLGTGANALSNAASLVNDALAGGVFAVAGNHISLDAIVQINAWSDSDSIGASLDGWNGMSHQAATAAFNIAEMQRIDTSTSDGAGAAHPGFPKAWVVTEISGDYVSLNWVQQLNFVTDNDTAFVTSSHGVTTMVGTGENQTFNNVSIADLGQYYDLVLIGGNYYDANIIAQTNVLLDDDVAGSIGGFHTSGTGSVSTGDNLLWNDARIVTVGSNTVDALPSGFAKALQDFEGGDHTLGAAVLNDDAFQGMAGLRVLYISGSIYDLQYIHQTNVLGDSDQIALAMNTTQAGDGGDWSVTTGSDALINTARIVDADPAAKTYVGGDHYSDELLVQTDIIRTDHLLETRDGDHLVNEAVAFLSDDMAHHDAAYANPDDPISALQAPVDVHPAHADIMQSVIS